MLTLRVVETYLLMTLVFAAAQLPIGSGDVRHGYESRDFVTKSEAVDLEPGARLELAQLAVPLGLPPLAQEADARAVALGRSLFFDRRLSVNGTLSCGMCHIPEQGFAQNELATPVGFQGRSVRRNAPSLYNVVYLPRLFFDGRETSLEAQIWSPLLADNEMANPDQAAVLERLAGLDEYVDRFDDAYADGLSAENLGHALASYQRALLSGASSFDRWYFGGDDAAVSDQVKAGFRVFREVGCAACHTVGKTTALFTDHGFYNTGIAYRSATQPQPRTLQIAPGVHVALTVEVDAPAPADDGLAEVSGRPDDRGRFRVPSLRNVALTAPYMHDGSLRSLAAVIEYYDAGGAPDPLLDRWILPLGMSKAQKAALQAFLVALTGTNVAALAADARSVPIGERETRRGDSG